MTEDEMDVSRLLIRHELGLKKLYEVFANMFQNHKDFWLAIAADEQKHADWLSELFSNATIFNWFRSESQLKPQALKASLAHIEHQIAGAEEGAFNLLHALSIARDFESALLERQFPQLTESAPKEIKPVLMNIINDTRRHLNMVLERHASEKQKSLK